MNTIALIFWLVTITIITAITVYFFIRVLKAPKKTEPDSFECRGDFNDK